MRILALETSAPNGSVAAVEDDRLLGQTCFDPEQRAARAFAPAILKQLASVGWRPEDIQLIAVTQGPGSFTGLRIGVTAAKTLAYTVGAEVIGVNTLKVIAFQTPPGHRRVRVVLDAQRGQLFAATFQRHGAAWDTVAQTHIIDGDDWLRSLTADEVVTGAGLAKLQDRLPSHAVVVDREHWIPQAATVGQVGHLEHRSGKRDDLWKLAPQYYRKSAAEEKFEAKDGNRQ
jgi:tRNA threonylcarbamoyladenosine biosynthesis protein TsaB